MATTIVDYIDRTADVAAFQGWEDTRNREVLLEQEIHDAGGGGEVITGVFKLVQRFLLTLLTVQGSLKYLPGLGCTFISDARRGRWRTSADVKQSFYFALLDCKRQLREVELTGDPDDEKVADVAVVSIELSPQDRAVLRLYLTTLAGTGREFLAPIAITPR